jgi:glucose/mannose transport system substrate-binding protein
MDKFPQGLLDLMSYEGGIYSVALNIHRSNVMWYVPAKLEEWGVTAPATWDDFLAACPTLQEKGVLPLSVGENWTQTHLWESVAVASLGAENWNKLWAGELDPAGAEMLAVWDLFGKVLDCTNINEDAAGLSWQQATDKVVNGEAAFNIMGDWAAGYMTTTLGLVPGEGFGYVPSPGTDGTFIMLADSFGLPVGIANRDSAVAWLSLVGSVEGQNTFNPLKGSIPARLDADVANNDAYNAYLKSAAEDWGTDTVVGSLAHGAAANENFSGSFSSVLEIFIPSRDPAAATAVMVELCTSSSACGSME